MRKLVFSKSWLLFSLLAFLALSGCTKSPMAWWKSVNQKAKHLAELEAKYEALQAEHDKLKRAYLKLEHEHSELMAKETTVSTAKESLAATGNISGRSPAQISYTPPHGLSAAELQALAYEHMREERFAEAAVTFESLLADPEAAALQDANTMYSAGISWFQVGNFKKAREQFDAATAHASGENKDKIRKKVELWMRVLDRKVASVPSKHTEHKGH